VNGSGTSVLVGARGDSRGLAQQSTPKSIGENRVDTVASRPTSVSGLDVYLPGGLFRQASRAPILRRDAPYSTTEPRYPSTNVPDTRFRRCRSARRAAVERSSSETPAFPPVSTDLTIPNGVDHLTRDGGERRGSAGRHTWKRWQMRSASLPPISRSPSSDTTRISEPDKSSSTTNALSRSAVVLRSLLMPPIGGTSILCMTRRARIALTPT